MQLPVIYHSQSFAAVSRLPLSIICYCNNPNLSHYPLLFRNLRCVNKKKRETDYPDSMYAAATFTFAISNLNRGFPFLNSNVSRETSYRVYNHQLFTIVSRLPLSVIYYSNDPNPSLYPLLFCNSRGVNKKT